MRPLHPKKPPKWGSKELKLLQQDWYRKLRNEGFDDIEYPARGKVNRPLLAPRGHKGHVKRTITRGTYFKNEEYYRVAGHLLHSHDWTKEPRWKHIAFEMYCEGESMDEITDKLRADGEKIHYKLVMYFIHEMQELMHGMAYAPEFKYSAEKGEKVVLVGRLLEPCGDYEWTIELEDGSLIDAPESGMKYDS